MSLFHSKPCSESTYSAGRFVSHSLHSPLVTTPPETEGQADHSLIRYTSRGTDHFIHPSFYSEISSAWETEHFCIIVSNFPTHTHTHTLILNFWVQSTFIAFIEVFILVRVVSSLWRCKSVASSWRTCSVWGAGLWEWCHLLVLPWSCICQSGG